MPELPEVETIKLGLQKFIVGKEISQISFDKPKMIEGNVNNALGTKVVSIKRYAKILEITLSNKKSLLLHLKMTGQIIVVAGHHRELAGGHPVPALNAKVPNKSTHITIKFADGGMLYFNDLRQFGWLKIIDTKDVSKEKFIKNLGPEPLSKKFTGKYLQETLSKTKKVVKSVLLDQEKVAGLGNIYSDEALWWAKIHPLKPANELSSVEINSLHKGIKRAIKDGIKHRGSSMQSYVTIEGEKGTYLHVAKAYHQEKCSRCGSLIKKVKVNGRTAHYCSLCQKD